MGVRFYGLPKKERGRLDVRELLLSALEVTHEEGKAVIYSEVSYLLTKKGGTNADNPDGCLGPVKAILTRGASQE